MGKQQPASYYDQVYSNSQEYSKPWQNSRYVKVWERMVQRFNKELSVHDLGCGVGQTAHFMKDQGFKFYYGVDFSEIAIEKAAKSSENSYLRKNGKSCRWENGYYFRCRGIIDYISSYNPESHGLSELNQFFLSEVLEHIENDEAILAVLSQKFTGSRISLSVPTFDDKSHVRHFKSTISVKERYSPFINIQDLSQIGPWIIVQGRLK
jgi:SAM-dependent methyltransferase